MKKITVYDTARGSCIICKKESGGSSYWTPFPPKIWLKLRPIVAKMGLQLGWFIDKDHIVSSLFIPPHTKPLCSAECSLKFKEQ